MYTYIHTYIHTYMHKVRTDVANPHPGAGVCICFDMRAHLYPRTSIIYILIDIEMYVHYIDR